MASSRNIPRGRYRATLVALITAVLVVPLVLLAYPDSPPLQVTGMTGQGTCANCHMGNTLQAGAVTIAFPGGTTYTPGATQQVTVTVSETGKSRWGYELTARLASNTANQAGGFAATDALSQVRCSDGSQKPAGGCPTSAATEYVSHTFTGTQSGTPNTAHWTFNWTAPPAGSGAVTFWVAGLAADGTGGSSNDDTGTASVTLTEAAPPPPSNTLTVNPLSLTFNGVAGGTAPPTKTFNVSTSGASVGFTTTTATTTGGTWLSAVTGGNTPMDVTVTATPPANLGPGTYNGTVRVSANGVTNSPQTVNVSLTLTAPPVVPTLSTNPVSPLTFVAASGGAAVSQTLQVSSNPTGVAFAAAASTVPAGGTWLSVSPLSGNTSGSGGLTVTVNPSSLAPGNYTGAVTISGSASNSPLVVAVNLTVTKPSLGVSPASLTFNATAGTQVPSQQVQLTSTGSAIAVSATPSTTSGGAWLSVGSASGPPTRTSPATVAISVSTTGLAAGTTYHGSVSFTSADAANSPQTLNVTLNVGSSTPPPPPPPPSGTTPPLSFSFSVVDSQSGGVERLLLSGNGSVDKNGVLTGSGQFTRYLVSSSGKHSTVSTGTWAAKNAVSFTPVTTTAESDSEENGTGGTLIINIDLKPKGAPAVPAVLQIAATGDNSGVTMTITGGSTYVPTGTGRVVISTGSATSGDHEDGH